MAIVRRIGGRSVPIGFAVVVALVVCSPASAAVVADQTTYLTGSGAVGSLTCHAVVDLGGSGVYTYSYELTYTTGTADVHIYKVQNPNDSAYSAAQNVPIDGSQFDNPTYSAIGWIPWVNGNLAAGDRQKSSGQLERRKPPGVVSKHSRLGRGCTNPLGSM